jgi:hypothetical protein
MLGNAWLFAILAAAFLVHPLPAAADETQSMMNGAPNADATLRDKKGNAGPPVEGADPGMVKSAPEHGKSDKPMVAKPPPEGMDPGIHAPGASLSGTPTPPK